MDFVFGRRSSRDSGDEDGSSLKSSITEGSSRLLGSMMGVKNGLFDGISSKFDQVSGKFDQVMKLGESTESEPDSPNPANTMTNTNRPKQRPNRPPPVNSRSNTLNGGVRQGSIEGRQSSRPGNRGNTVSFDDSPYTMGQDESYQYYQKPAHSSDSGVIPDITAQADYAYCSVRSPPSDFPGTGLLGDNLLPGIPRVPSVNTSTGGGLNVSQGQDLLAITPTTSARLPMPVEPSQAVPTQRRIPANFDSDGSSSTEGCDEVADQNDFSEYDYDSGMLRSGSMGSDKSWSSADSQLDEVSKESMEFMKYFGIFSASEDNGILQMDKARFGELCQYGTGRLWFARYVSAQRAERKKVVEYILYRLVQYFAIALFECNETEDYGPAKTLMNMCFTFYYEVTTAEGENKKHFLYNFLRDQPIWWSLRFWNAAFFDAVQHERSRRPVPTRRDGSDTQMDDREFQENITFGQLGTFMCNMQAFGLSKDLCLEFLRKQSTIANLRPEQVRMLRENVEKGQEN